MQFFLRGNAVCIANVSHDTALSGVIGHLCFTELSPYITLKISKIQANRFLTR